MGENGSILIADSDTDPHKGPFCAIEAFEVDVVLGTVTGNCSWLTGKTLVAGEPARVGRIETVARSSGGALIAYYASDYKRP